MVHTQKEKKEKLANLSTKSLYTVNVSLSPLVSHSSVTTVFRAIPQSYWYHARPPALWMVRTVWRWAAMGPMSSGRLCTITAVYRLKYRTHAITSVVRLFCDGASPTELDVPASWDPLPSSAWIALLDGKSSSISIKSSSQMRVASLRGIVGSPTATRYCFGWVPTGSDGRLSSRVRACLSSPSLKVSCGGGGGGISQLISATWSVWMVGSFRSRPECVEHS